MKQSKYRFYHKTGKANNTHLIDNYDAKARIIYCVCDWIGHEDDFFDHQINSPATDRPAPEERFPASKFDESIVIAGVVGEMHWTEKLRRLVNKDPGLFDYVQEKKIALD